MVERSQLLDGSRVLVDDVAIALASSGVHSNGFSLVRKVLADCIFPEQSVPLSVILNEHHPDSLGGHPLGKCY
jgi:phosphoribosylformylglycinamidine cyclo-ligase